MQPSVRGRNFGVFNIDGKKKQVQLVDGEATGADGAPNANAAPIVTIANDQIATMQRKGQDFVFQFKKNKNQQGVVMQEVKLAVPKGVQGFQDSPDPLKTIQAQIQEEVMGMDAAATAQAASGARAGIASAAAGVIGPDQLPGAMTKDNFGEEIGNFDSVTLTTPNGLFTMHVGTKGLFFQDESPKKRDTNKFVLPYADINKMFMLPAPEDKTAVLGVFAFKNTIRLCQGVAPVRCLVLVLAKDDSIFTEAEPWPPIMDAAKVKDQLGLGADTLHGDFNAVVMKVVKAASGQALVGANADVSFPTGPRVAPCCLSAFVKSNSGHLFVQKTALVFLVKGAFYLPFENIGAVRFEMPDTGDSMVVVVEGTLPGAPKAESLKFQNVNKKNLLNLITYLKEKDITVHEPKGDDDSDDDDDDSDDDGDVDLGSAAGGSDSDDDDYDDSDDDDDDDDSSRPARKKKAAPKKKEKKEKSKKEKSKKEKKDKSDKAKKEKKDKSDKKEKKSKKDKEGGSRRERDD